MIDRRNKIKDNIRHGINGEIGNGSVFRVKQQISMALEEIPCLANNLMERICDKANLNRAYKRVKSNKGAAGVDGMTVDELLPYLKKHGTEITQTLLNGSYRPQVVRGVEIPKPNGGKRLLGIPTVLDRFIQQAILQIMEPIFDPTFSDFSFGFRPKRSAHQAIKCASDYVKSGHKIVVDIDLEKYFDRVNHDILMSRLARRIGDRRLLKILREFLKAGILQNGVCTRREEGTPQGGPLSPLLSNILLDELDRELERRGHKFCRYADDCNIYVQTTRAGNRVMESIKQFLGKRLKLRINETKSAVAPVRERKFLGYRIQSSGHLSIASESLKRMKNKIRMLTKRNRGVKLERVIAQVTIFLRGWLNYFQLIRSRRSLEELDKWLRRRLRCYRLKQRKRRYPIAKFLMQLGVPKQNAWNLAMSGKGWWRKSHNPVIQQAMPNEFFEKLGLLNLSKSFDLLEA